MSHSKKQILIWGDDAVLLRIIDQLFKETPELADYTVLDRIEYSHTSFVTGDVLKSADIVLYGLFRRHGERLRAEGVSVLGARLRAGKLGLIYGVGIAPVASNPLIWDMIDSIPLARKLADLSTIKDPLSCWEKLNDYFSESIFVVDGHR